MLNALFNLFSGGFGYLGSFFRHTSVFRKAFRVALFAYFSCGLNYGETEITTLAGKAMDLFD